MAETLFELPTEPDAFGIVLPSAELRRLDFSGLDYVTARRVIIEYIQTYFPDHFNDFVASNGIMMMTEILSSIVGKLSLRSDMLHDDNFLPSAKSEAAVVNHLLLINQHIRRQTPATIDVELTVTQPTFTDIEVDAGTSFQLTGPDNKPVYYEIYRAPGDFTSKVVIPAGKRGVIAYGIEGKFASTVTTVSGGGPNQEFIITDKNILEAPITVTIISGDVREEWTVVSEPIEKYSSTDKVVEVLFIGDDVIFRFGDDVAGAAPMAGQQIEVNYRVGGGIRGRIGIGVIDTTRSITPLPPANASVSVHFRNITPSMGGTDKETLEQAKKRAPRDAAVRKSIVTDTDYAQVAGSFSHPVFGTVSKALATIRTGYNANLVEIYILAEGEDGRPATPSDGLKLGLKTYYDDLNVLTDHVEILDGVIHPVDIDMNVIMSRNSDGTVVKEKVEAAISDFFDSANWDMGESFYISKFIKTVEDIDGVAYVDLFTPANNILATNELVNTSTDGIGLNELIVEGQRVVRYFYQRAR